MTLQKRWKNLRDCFTRELRRLKDIKSGSAAYVKRKVNTPISTNYCF